MQYFNGKPWIEPAAGSKIITNVAPTANLLATGIVAVIGESDGGLTIDDNIVYESDQPSFLKDILLGGVSSKCLDYIFSPSLNTPGANKVLFIRAQKATKATATITQSTGGSVTFVMKTKDKGAYLSDVSTGLKWKLVAGTVDNTKDVLILQYLGQVLWTSPEVATYKELIDSIEADSFANSWISAEVTSGTSTTAIDNSVRTVDYAVFTGGTSPNMTGNDIDDALSLLAPHTPNFIFLASEDATLQSKIVSFINNTAELKIQAFSGGAAGETVAEVKARSLTFNDENVTLAYPDIFMPKEDGSGSESLSPMYFAAMQCGLKAGLPPHEPITWKKVNVLGFNPVGGEMTKTVREELITAGVCVGRKVPGVGFAINKGINTLQNNGSMIYKKTDGEATSPEISLITIKNQLQREMIVNSAPLFIGGTAATVTQEDVINFVTSYLNSRTSTPTEANMLIDFGGITATLVDDAWKVSYWFIPNTPVNFTFYTGAMLKP